MVYWGGGDVLLLFDGGADSTHINMCVNTRGMNQ